MNINEFKSGEVVLPGLRSIILPPDTFLHMAEVPNLRKYYREAMLALVGGPAPLDFVDRIIDTMGINVYTLLYEDDLPDGRTKGFCKIFHPRIGGRYAILGQRRGLTPEDAVKTAGYISGVLLDRLGKREVLQQWMAEEGISINLDQSDATEVAKLAGLLARHYHINQKEKL